MRTGENGEILGQHFATPHARAFVVNGFSLRKTNDMESSKPQSGVPKTLSELHGTGGGSFCNHSNTPNARLVRSEKDEGYGIFVVALRDIVQIVYN